MEIGNYQGSRNRAVTDTDKNGFALFRGVAPGSYHLSADHDAGIPDGVELEVKLNGPADVTVHLKWPSTAPVLVRSLKGRVRRSDYLPEQSQPRLSLDLLEGNSGRTLKSLQTTDSGDFDFERDAPGLYFLSVKQSGLSGLSGNQVTGLVAVAVDHAASTDQLDVDVGWTSCGLWYSDRSKCPQSDLQVVGRLSGQVLDASGAAIPDAKILLFDPAETLVEWLQSDRAGKFALPHSLGGTYQLVVTMSGFTPLRRTLHAEPTGNPTHFSALTVQLGVSGSCSTADLR